MSRSALYGRPPATDNDFWIVKAMLFQMGLVNADPTKGLPLKQFPPPNDESKAGSIIAGVTISIFLVLSITTTRIIARKLISTSSLGWDDALIVVAALAVISWFGIVAGMVAHGGAGRHLFDLTYMEYYWFARLGRIGSIMLYVASAFAKFSIIFFNIRLTGLTSVIWIWVHRIFFLIVLAYSLLALFFMTMACQPYKAGPSLIEAGKAVPNYKCNANAVPVALALQFLHSILDWMLLAVPIIVLIRLKMSWQRKAQCIIPLSIGALSAVGASKRTYDAYHPPKDPTFHFAGQLPWSIVDLVCAVCVTSLPAVNNLIIHHLPKHLSSYWSGGDPGSSPSQTSQRSRGGLTSRSRLNATNGRDLKNNGGVSVDEETKQITVQRDVDLESMRTEMDQHHDAGFLELDDSQRSYKSYVGT
ncbi:MAG: hypothetical protein LQ339_002456 [Xanthoria mediterranea]|nr:MAG: hypothetical protein LQ339_002456 [Xanthoria mediterranea]